jgi:RluA family pseudouridine synthase
MDWIVLPSESGTRLLAFLQSKLPSNLSARHIKRIIEQNLCLVNERTERFATVILGKGDRVTLLSIELPQTTEIAFHPDRVLYEDDEIFMYDKPPHIVSDDKIFLKTLKRDLPYLAVAHRLDRDTSGVLLFGKSPSAYQSLLKQFKDRKIKKSYLAIVEGIPKQNKGLIDNYLGPIHHYQGQTIWGEVSKSKGQHAITLWEVVKKGKNASLIRCFPETGRTHQLRVHLNSIGHPILGDFQYCRSFHCPYRPERMLLHAESLALINPVTNEITRVSAPVPPDFNKAMGSLFKGQT